jgi:hypothetical protein
MVAPLPHPSLGCVRQLSLGLFIFQQGTSALTVPCVLPYRLPGIICRQVISCVQPGWRRGGHTVVQMGWQPLDLLYLVFFLFSAWTSFQPQGLLVMSGCFLAGSIWPWD